MVDALEGVKELDFGVMMWDSMLYYVLSSTVNKETLLV